MNQLQKYFVPILIVALNLSLLSFTSFSQDHAGMNKRVQLVKDGKVDFRTAVFPRSLESKLNKLFVGDPRTVKSLVNPALPGRIYGGAGLIRVIPYFQVTPGQDQNGHINAQALSHPESYPALLTADRLYVFSEEDVCVDTEIFNEYLADLGPHPDDLEIQGLANLYLQATRGYSETKGKIVVNTVNDIPHIYKSRAEAEARRLRSLIAAPKKKRAGDHEVLVLYTWEAARGEVRRWMFESDIHSIEVQTEVIGRL